MQTRIYHAISSKQFVLFSSSKISLLNFVLYDIAMSYACKHTHVIVAMCTYKTHGNELCGQQIRLLGGCLHNLNVPVANTWKTKLTVPLIFVIEK